MKTMRFLFAGAAVVALVAAGALAQDAAAPKAPAAKPMDPEVQALTKELIGKLGTKNPNVRQVLRAALVQVGRDAVPMLQEAMKSDDAGTAAFAKEIVEAINNPRRGGPNQGRGPVDAEQLAKDLGLDADKTKKLKDVQDKMREKTRELMQEMREGGLDRQSMQEEMQQLRKEAEGKLKEFLTEEQIGKVMESMQQGMRGGRRGPGGGGEGGGEGRRGGGEGGERRGGGGEGGGGGGGF